LHGSELEKLKQCSVLPYPFLQIKYGSAGIQFDDKADEEEKGEENEDAKQRED